MISLGAGGVSPNPTTLVVNGSTVGQSCAGELGYVDRSIRRNDCNAKRHGPSLLPLEMDKESEAEGDVVGAD
jgi:hypothetical protein